MRAELAANDAGDARIRVNRVNKLYAMHTGDQLKGFTNTLEPRSKTLPAMCGNKHNSSIFIEEIPGRSGNGTFIKTIACVQNSVDSGVSRYGNDILRDAFGDEVLPCPLCSCKMERGQAPDNNPV